MRAEERFSGVGAERGTSMLILTLVLIMSQMRSEICSISLLRNTQGGTLCVQVVGHVVEKYTVVL